ncbi:hypothetical protein BH09ACT5_BH09ACT5_07860 [soil metagenome]
MFESIRSAIVRPAAERWLRRSRTSWRTLPLPTGPAAARTDGPDPDRILLFGSGIAMGYGVKSHDLALAGQLARQVSDLTRRGVQIDVVASEHTTVENALNSLSTSRLRELDAIVATPGGLERLLLMPVSIWRRRVESLLDQFSASAPASLRVLFVAVPELSKVVRMPWLLGTLADASARALNRALEAACAARPFAEFVPFRPVQQAGREGTGRTYSHWASLIAPSVARALDAHARASH